jgi:hypothetical protein
MKKQERDSIEGGDGQGAGRSADRLRFFFRLSEKKIIFVET